MQEFGFELELDFELKFELRLEPVWIFFFALSVNANEKKNMVTEEPCHSTVLLANIEGSFDLFLDGESNMN